jgi:hypothetical protein
MRALFLAPLLALQPSTAQASVTYLDCSLPDIEGKMSPWTIKLNEEDSIVEVGLGGPSSTKMPATFRPDSITFQFFQATVEINRVTGAIKRTRVDKDGAHIGEGKCTVAKPETVF